MPTDSWLNQLRVAALGYVGHWFPSATNAIGGSRELGTPLTRR
jgi:hypothetical protein